MCWYILCVTQHTERAETAAVAAAALLRIADGLLSLSSSGVVSLSSLEAHAAYPPRALQLFATAAAWGQQQGFPARSSAPELAAAVPACLAAAQELLPHKSAACIAQLLVCMAALQSVDPGLLQPAPTAAVATTVLDVDLLLELAVRELSSGKNCVWLVQQQQQQSDILADVKAACQVLGMSAATTDRIGLN